MIAEQKVVWVPVSVGHTAPHSHVKVRAREQPLVACIEMSTKTTKMNLKSLSSVRIKMFSYIEIM